MKHVISMLTCAALLTGCDCSTCDVDTAKTADTVPAAVTIEPVSAQPTSTAWSFSVKGMHCGGCANSLRQVINECNGVMTASVSYDDSSATVNVRSKDALECALAVSKELGYETGDPEELVWDTQPADGDDAGEAAG